MQQVIAVDFGTSRTSISRCPLDELNASPIHMDPAGLGIESAILYRPGKRPLIGSWATAEWGSLERKAHSNYTLKVHFKPEVANCALARQAAEDFFKELLILAEESYMPLWPERNRVYFGVPSEADGAFKDAILKMAKGAGFGTVDLIPEPIGALLYHISMKDISASKARRGVLVIDFGGGTCDFALLEDLNVVASWGDMHFGGRLFDDLFFQWFLEENPGSQRIMEEEGSQYFLHWYRCRQLKEDFSSFMAHHRKDKWSYSIPGYGRLEDATWEEFIHRAENYRPTKEFLDYLKSTNSSSPLLTGESIDLLLWFQELLLSGLNQNHISANRIEKVILVGGSSLWPFVPDMVQRVLKVDKNAIFRSEQPHVVISQGMSLYPALKFKNENSKVRLTRDLRRFLDENIRGKLLVPMALRVAQDISQRSATIIFEDKMRPLLNDFKDQGGSIADLERRFQREVSGSMDEIQVYIQRKLEEASKRLPYEIMEELSLWFQSAGIYFTGESHYNYLASDDILEDFQPDDRFYKEIFRSIEALIYAITATIVASICGGTGLAIITAGPIGLFIGALIGMATAVLGMAVAKERIKEIYLHPKVLRMLLTNRKINSVIEDGKRDFSKHINESIQREMSGISQDIMEEARLLIEREVSSISALSHFDF